MCCSQCFPSLRNRGGRGWKSLKKTGGKNTEIDGVLKKSGRCDFQCGMCSEGECAVLRQNGVSN